MSEEHPEGTPTPGVTRRRVLGGAGLAGAGLVAGAAAGAFTEKARADETVAEAVRSTVPFYGTHQAGILTPQQSRLVFAAFDVTTSDVEALEALLGRWSAAAALMTKGQPVGPTSALPASPPADTGEAVGLGAQDLTVTVGFGTTLFDDRFGIADRRPAALAPLPVLPGDTEIQAGISGGDLCVQACAGDPQVAFHVIRNFARIARGTAVLRWSQVGFGRASATSRDQDTPRNLLGFKDGTNNLKIEDAKEAADHVWVGDEADQDWMRDGSYLVTRKIRMTIENWDSDSYGDQEHVFGRTKGEGAPIGKHHEFDPIDLSKLAPHSHVRLAHTKTKQGIEILRRGYNYADGIDPDTGQIDAGLFFMAYQKNAHEQFVPLQESLGQHDLLNEYIVHRSSALFAIPPGLSKVGDWYGKALFRSV